MANAPLTSVTRIQTLPSSYLPPLFLAPALAHLSFAPSTSLASHTLRPHPHCKARSFSATSCHQSRPIRREKNKSRGVSAIRRTGPRVPLPIAKYELPQPVTDPSARKEFKTNPKHGLWAFFNADKTAMSSPEEEHAHGRAWTYAELSYKSFEDLHGLYWVCVKERNRIATAKKERHRVYAGFGDYESQNREAAVVKTMGGIRRVLTDRYHSWQEAMAILNRTSVKDLPLDQEEAYEDVNEDGKFNDAEMDKLPDEKASEVEERKQTASPAIVTA